MRSPFLKLGGDTQFSMLSNNHFDYDCSMATRFDDDGDGDGDGDGVLSRDFGYLDAQNGLYPYTLDYASVQVGFWPKIFLADTWKSNIYMCTTLWQDCAVGPCPTCSYPGLWEQPMLDLEGARTLIFFNPGTSILLLPTLLKNPWPNYKSWPIVHMFVQPLCLF